MAYNRNVPKLLPPIFDADLFSADDYLREFNYYANLNRWTLANKVSYFRHFLHLKYKPWFDSLDVVDGQPILLWDALEDAFRLKFRSLKRTYTPESNLM